MQIVLLQDIEGEKAEELVKKCPANVFDIEDIGKGKLDPNFVAAFSLSFVFELVLNCGVGFAYIGWFKMCFPVNPIPDFRIVIYQFIDCQFRTKKSNCGKT